jgi:hypothetical protein
MSSTTVHPPTGSPHSTVTESPVTRHLSVQESPRGGWDAFAELEHAGGPTRLSGHGGTREEAIADLRANVADFESLWSDAGGAL